MYIKGVPTGFYISVYVCFLKDAHIIRPSVSDVKSVVVPNTLFIQMLFRPIPSILLPEAGTGSQAMDAYSMASPLGCELILSADNQQTQPGSIFGLHGHVVILFLV